MNLILIILWFIFFFLVMYIFVKSMLEIKKMNCYVREFNIKIDLLRENLREENLILLKKLRKLDTIINGLTLGEFISTNWDKK